MLNVALCVKGMSSDVSSSFSKISTRCSASVSLVWLDRARAMPRSNFLMHLRGQGHHFQVG